MTASNPPEKRVPIDEQSYVNRKPEFIRAADLMKADVHREPGVIPHNTMRFDVQLASIYAMLDDDLVTVEAIVNQIRKAIIQAVEETVGVGLDGCAIPGGAMIMPVRDSVMLHREAICFDLS